MKKAFMLALLLGILSPFSWAQDKPRAEDNQKAEVRTTPVKVQIVFTEFEGDKKVKSLPYTLYINALDAPEVKPGWVKLRVGSRVPVYTGGTAGNMTYLDVGTNIDARSAYAGEGRLLLYLRIERSWVEGGVSVPVAKSDGSASETPAVIFRSQLSASLFQSSTSNCAKGNQSRAPWLQTPLAARCSRSTSVSRSSSDSCRVLDYLYQTLESGGQIGVQKAIAKFFQQSRCDTLAG